MKLCNSRQFIARSFALCLLLGLATVVIAQANSLQPTHPQSSAQSEDGKGKKKKSVKKSGKKNDEAETAAPAMPASNATGTAAAATPDATALEAPAPTGKKQKGGGGSKKAKGGANANTSASTAIRGLLDAQAAAWNAGNLEEFMRSYWNSPELTFVSGGRKVMGYNATIERYRRTYQAEGKEMGKLTFSDLEITQLGNDAAFVRGQFQLIMSDAREMGGRYTLILRLFPDGWKIIHDHTSSN